MTRSPAPTRYGAGMQQWQVVVWFRDHPRITDGALASVLVCGFLLGFATEGPRPLDLRTALLGATSLAVVGGRRAAPRLVFVVAGAATFAALATGSFFAPDILGPMLALYTIATSSSRRDSGIACGVALLGVAVAVFGLSRPQPFAWQDVVAPLAAILGTWVLGDNLKVRRAYVAQLEERAEHAEADRRQEIERAALDERSRIARELHDVVAHHVGVIAVQAGAARVATQGAGPADELIVSIERTARQALTELRRLLGVLRRSDQDVELTPQPGLARLDELVEQVRGVGLPVDLSIEGFPLALEQGADVSAYRIVQEALTNVLKHGGAAPTQVRVRYQRDAVELVITDCADGSRPLESVIAPPAVGSASGQGLIGMRERVALFGGELDAGPRADGGFEVRARLPVRRGRRAS